MKVGVWKRAVHDFLTHLKRTNDFTGSHANISSTYSSRKLFNLHLLESESSELKLKLHLLDLRPHLHFESSDLKSKLHILDLDIFEIPKIWNP